MAWEYINYDYATAYLFQKILLWADKNCNIYFATKLNADDSWSYYGGNVSHALATGNILTPYSTEVDAQTNYLTTVRDSNGKILCVLPYITQAKYIRVYIETGAGVTIHEFTPSTYFTAHEIISGELHITDQLSDAPKIRVTKSSIDRVKIGNIEATRYGIAGYDSSASKIFELSNARQNLAGWNFTSTRLTSGQVSLSGKSGKIKTGGVEIGSGRVLINTASGVVIKSGGDIYLEANATNPGRLTFKNSGSNFFLGANKVNTTMSFSPVASNLGVLRIGDVGWWGYYWKDIYIRSKEDVEIYAGSNNDYCSLTLDSDNSPNITQWKCQPSANNFTMWTLYSNTESYLSFYDAASEIYKLRIWRNTPHTYSAIEMDSNGAVDNLFVFDSNGSDRFTFGIDASDGYKYKIATGFGLGTNDKFWISSEASICLLNEFYLTKIKPPTIKADSAQIWVGDINNEAGKAGIYTMYEAIATPLVLAPVILKKTTGDPATAFETLFCINASDNNVKIYADGGWRQLATW